MVVRALGPCSLVFSEGQRISKLLEKKRRDPDLTMRIHKKDRKIKKRGTSGNSHRAKTVSTLVCNLCFAILVHFTSARRHLLIELFQMSARASDHFIWCCSVLHGNGVL